MSTNNHRSRSKERFWRRMMRQCQGSGLSVRAFCEEHGLSEPNFYAWRRILRERDAAAVNFVPVQVVPGPMTASPADQAGGVVELVIGAGRRLRIAPGFDGPTLQRLLALLEEGQA